MNNTIENNKMLAEFMCLNSIVENNGVFYKDNNTNNIHEIKYHSDWNWLMQVIEKIESLDNCDYFKISSEYVEIQARFGKKIIFRPTFFDVDEYNDSKIETVYNACLEFIKWYNDNK